MRLQRTLGNRAVGQLLAQTGTLLPTPQEGVAEAQRQAAALEARLVRYRERFGELKE